MVFIPEKLREGNGGRRKELNSLMTIPPMYAWDLGPVRYWMLTLGNRRVWTEKQTTKAGQECI